MNQKNLKDVFARNHLPDEVFKATYAIGLAFEEHTGGAIETATTADLDAFVAHELKDHLLSVDFFIALMRLSLSSDRQDLFVRTTMYTGGLDVIENITARLQKMVSETLYETIMDGVVLPVLGTHPDDVPRFTADFVNRLEAHLTEQQVHRALVGNNHGLDTSVLAAEKVLYQQAPSLDAYLLDRHRRQVETLESHARSGKVWFEQIITDEVVDHVKAHPEMLSAVRKNDVLHIRKIPYDTKAYLKAEDDVTRRYHACHCPFAKASIRSDHPVQARWCDCSAGFAKVLFDVLFDADLPVSTVKSALAGDDHCAFELSLEGVPYKH